MSQTSTERLRDYLAQLPPQSQALLMREFERAIERGEDLAVANFSSNTVSVLLGNGNGTFQTQAQFATGATPHLLQSQERSHTGRSRMRIVRPVCGKVAARTCT